MLEIFCDWARQISLILSTGEVDARLTLGGDSPNPAARLDFDTPSLLARITCWDSGDYNAEILDLESEQYIFARNGRLEQSLPLTGQLQEFFAALKIDPSGAPKRRSKISQPG